jgi:uncharacterized membrane protein
MEPELYAVLDERLRRLERESASLRADLSAAARGLTPVQAPASAATPVPENAVPVPPSIWAVPARPARPAFSFEAFFAGRGLQLVGLVLVLLGVAFFLNLAFTRGWVGPAERILLGLVCGVALVALGARTLRANGTPVAESLIGLGGGILYLSSWAAVVVFPQLHVGRSAAFVTMVAITGVLVAISATRRSERVALLALVGGFLTPVLLNTGTPAPEFLAGYVLILGLAFATLAVSARFRFVEGAAFVASALYLPDFGPAAGFSTPEAYGVATAIFALFAITFSVGAIRDASARPWRLALLSVDAFCYVAMLQWIFNDKQTTLGIAMLVLSAATLAAARLVRPSAGLTRAYAYIGLSAATLALPSLLRSSSLTDAFILEGAVLAILGARRKDAVVAVAGNLILGAVALWLLADALIAPPANTSFSSLTLSFVIAVAALAFARAQLRDLTANAATIRGWSAVINVATNVLALAGISRILLDAFGGPTWNIAVPGVVQVGVSFAWMVYATALFGLGLARRNALFQRQGLVLLAIVIFKVFTIDLSNVDVTWRIVSFVVLGIVCMGISAWYMRVRARSQADPERAA